MAHVAFALAEGARKSIAGEGGGEDVAEGELVPDPGAAFDGGHHLADEGGALGKVDRGLLLEAADGLAVGGVVGHLGWCLGLDGGQVASGLRQLLSHRGLLGLLLLLGFLRTHLGKDLGRTNHLGIIVL